MRIKLLFLILALVFSAGIVGDAQAQTATFPAGCSSGWGYSVTTGDPCSGEDEAIMSVPGCSTPLGYSTVDGEPCSGGDVAISWLAGCSSVFGYSTITGLPCNGTAVASLQGSVPPPVLNSGAGSSVGGSVSSPGLPTTGSDENALANALFLGSSGLIAALGLVFLTRRSNA